MILRILCGDTCTAQGRSNMKYCFIINPSAGKGRSKDEIEKSIREVCDRACADYDVFVSGSSDEAEGYVARTMNGTDAEQVGFFACGGDGTLCKTVLAVMALPEEQRARAAVGVIPMGTGNDFVSNFKNKELFFDIDAQINSAPCKIDLLKCNDVYSINMVNIGFDCHVVCKKSEIEKKAWVPRKLAYVMSLLITLIKKPGVQMEVAIDKAKRLPKKLLLTTLANGAFCGGGFNSNPTAVLNDGQIDCIAVRNVSRTKFLTMVGSYKKGLHLGENFKTILDHFKCRDAHLYFEDETPVSVDGEIIRTRELHISVAGKAMTFMIPRGVVALRTIIEEATAQPATV